MNKMYVVDVRFYIPANDTEELKKVLGDMDFNGECYGGYEIVDIEETNDNFIG